jgi:hypothetical protein
LHPAIKTAYVAAHATRFGANAFEQMPKAAQNPKPSVPAVKPAMHATCAKVTAPLHFVNVAHALS